MTELVSIGRRRKRFRRDAQVDVPALQRALQSTLRGEVRFSAGDRALYATDAGNYRHLPIGVVIPRDREDVVRAVAVCREHGAPILARGGGTSLAGQCTNVAVVMDFSKYINRVLELDPGRRHARVEPGLIRDQLDAAAIEYDLTFGPDTATHAWATIGGMVGNNSCGIHSIMAGRTADNLESMEVLTYDGIRMHVGRTSDEEYEQILREGGRRGEIYRRLRVLRDRYSDLIRERYPRIPRRVSGYNLDELLPENGFHVGRALVGSESTCVTILEATVALVPRPPQRVLLVLGYPDVYQAGDHVPDVLEAKPIGLEGIDGTLVDYLEQKELHTDKTHLLPEGDGWLLVEFGGDTREEAVEHAQSLMRRLEGRENAPTMQLHEEKSDLEDVWTIRESGLGATAFVPGLDDTWPGWEDAAVPPERVGAYLRDFRALLQRHELRAALYGHFGDGCIHCRIDFDLMSAEGVRRYRRFVEESADLVVSYGGSLSGEHGDGQARSELLERMYGAELVSAFREFKSIWDPDGMMNPGRIVDPFSLDADLRLGADYSEPSLDTHFQYPADKGSFSRATLRCVGVGECRKVDSGTMCPSFMVLRDEKHTTRGRAHLLFEMLEGDPVRDGWRDERVKESLDLCLSCKACKGECPVNVDIATYKAEFLAHYYKGRLRSRSAYAFGLIYWWARVAALAPRLVNAALQLPLVGRVAKWAAGMPKERTIPRFAPSTFRTWFARRDAPRTAGNEVLLWPDTFNDHFHPGTAAAAVEVLEDAGFHVSLPAQSLCCGRPLYEYGMLDLAKRQLRQILDALRPRIRAGVAVVGLEPSCLSVFRDELPNLFPDDEDAKRLSEQSFTLAEFLQRNHYEPPRMRGRAIFHAHCHQKAVLDTDPDLELLRRVGLDVEAPDSGCCGMAGAFGFEREKYDVSIGAGERVLLPRIRESGDDTLIVTDGFSCREQVLQCTDRRPLHLAEVLQQALTQDRGTPAPEAGRPSVQPQQASLSLPRAAAAAALGAGAVAAGLMLRRRWQARVET
jgi:FAD/FMN-containing dehydrogenase/Fe-S oxidoreductase